MNEPIKYVLEDGMVEYRLPNGLCHRTDGPAIIYVNGGQEWCQNGLLHRTDGPAVIDNDGTQYWYQNGLLHRMDGPAVIDNDGTQTWYQNGVPYDPITFLIKLYEQTS